jgi:hypothetical protein
MRISVFISIRFRILRSLEKIFSLAPVNPKPMVLADNFTETEAAKFPL